MSRKNATAYIKKLNPKNKSGAIKEALNLLENLKKVKGMMNPNVPSAVGASNLQNAISQVAKDFAAPVDPIDQDVLTLEKILRKLGPRYGLLVDDVIKFGKEIFGYLTFDLTLSVPDDTLDRLSQDIKALTELRSLITTYETILDNSVAAIKDIRKITAENR
jgi:hypothetical protein